MLLVVMQHSYLSADMTLIPPLFDFFMWNVTGLAAVAFVSISGMMCSYFLYAHSDWRLAYRRYAKRAAFLLLAVHPLINLASYYFTVVGNGEFSKSRTFCELVLFSFPITDTIAVCLLTAPMIIICLGSSIRAVSIVAILVSTALIRAFVVLENQNWTIIQDAIFGGLGSPTLFWFPLAPWLAIFLTGSFGGYALAGLKKGVLDITALVRRMKRTGIVLAACGALLIVVYKILKISFESAWSPTLFLAIYPGQTTTLLPVYLAVLTLLFAVLVQKIDISGRYKRIFWLLSILGRTSLFTFVVQFAVVESVPAILGFKGSLGLTGIIALFVLGTMVMWLLAYLYGRMRGWISENDYAVCVNTARAVSKK